MKRPTLLALGAMAACAAAPAAAGVPTLKQVKWAANYELLTEALATVSCSAGSDCFSRRNLGRAKVRAANCAPVAERLARCSFEHDCGKAMDADLDGWCLRTADFKFDFTLDGKQRWQIASPN